MRILLADDHPLFAEALQTLIERSVPGSSLTVVGDLHAAHAALAGADRFDLAILDLHMPGSNGFAGVEQTLARFPHTPLALISGGATAADVARAIELGAKGFLPKDLPSKVLAAALQVLAAGGTYLPAGYAQSPAPSPAENRKSFANLTPRESEVLALLAAGRSNKEIGLTLNLQEITVKLHARNIYRKLGVRNRVEAANAAARLGQAAPDRPG
ncbi:MAG TPA: response regulator transcription factor [Stellaceae bacterium]|nr:response regulator transcription factor [Stellaceae bacterium]